MLLDLAIPVLCLLWGLLCLKYRALVATIPALCLLWILLCLRYSTFIAGIPILCLLWGLLCLRFYTLIGRDNVWQRRLIAIGAGLGAGLIWLLGSMILPWLRAPENPPPAAVESAGDIRIRPGPGR